MAQSSRGQCSFNPRSRAGSDQVSLVLLSSILSFNPRSRAGSDNRYDVRPRLYPRVSIHAPAQGATKSFQRSVLAALFQSTLPRGERPLCRANVKTPKMFQSTLPRGERRTSRATATTSASFNPRSRAGSDFCCFCCFCCSFQFQSTLPRGERQFKF